MSWLIKYGASYAFTNNPVWQPFADNFQLTDNGLVHWLDKDFHGDPSWTDFANMTGFDVTRGPQVFNNQFDFIIYNVLRVLRVQDVLLFHGHTSDYVWVYGATRDHTRFSVAKCIASPLKDYGITVMQRTFNLNDGPSATLDMLRWLVDQTVTAPAQIVVGAMPGPLHHVNVSNGVHLSVHRFVVNPDNDPYADPFILDGTIDIELSNL